MSSEEVKTQTGATHRPYNEAFKRAAVAQWQSGAGVNGYAVKGSAARAIRLSRRRTPLATQWQQPCHLTH